jgi:hypothetical protein
MANLQDIENKGDVLQDLGNAGVMVPLEPLEEQRIKCGGPGGVRRALLI